MGENAYKLFYSSAIQGKYNQNYERVQHRNALSSQCDGSNPPHSSVSQNPEFFHDRPPFLSLEWALELQGISPSQVIKEQINTIRGQGLITHCPKPNLSRKGLRGTQQRHPPPWDPISQICDARLLSHFCGNTVKPFPPEAATVLWA